MISAIQTTSVSMVYVHWVQWCSHFDTQCSRGVCDSTSGECVRVVSTKELCDDSLECTIDDKCSNSQCIGKEKKCYDNNPCTINKCVEGIGCMLKYENATGPILSTCLDSSNCPAGYVCADGTCVTSIMPVRKYVLLIMK